MYFALDEAVHCQLEPKYVSNTSLLNWYALDNQF
jgi:hypothetical protein